MNAWDKTLDIAGFVAVGILRAVGEIIGEREEALQGNRVSPKTGAKLDLMENSTTEFKTSIIFSPDDNQPSPSQPLKIAQEMAGFMNAEGGDLYLGVNDSGYVVGIQNDLDHLREAEICGQNEKSDRSFTYRPTRDAYSQKLWNIARFCLGAEAATFLDDPVFIHDNIADVDYVRLHVRPSRKKPVYCGRHKNFYRRLGPSVVLLEGEERDAYQVARFKSPCEQAGGNGSTSTSCKSLCDSSECLMEASPLSDFLRQKEREEVLHLW